MKINTKHCPCSFKIVSTRNLSHLVSGKTINSADYLYFVNRHRMGEESLWREEVIPTFDRAVMLKTGNDVGATIMSMLEIRAPDEPLSSNGELMMLLRSWLGQQFKAKLLELKTAGAVLQWLNESAEQILTDLGWEFLNSKPKDPEGTTHARLDNDPYRYIAAGEGLANILTYTTAATAINTMAAPVLDQPTTFNTTAQT